MKSDAMDVAYKKYHRELYLYALSLCRQEDMAKDLVSETFYKAFIASNVPKESFKYWLFKVLKNHYIDIKRKENKRKSMPYYDDTIPDNTSRGPSSSYLHKERDQRLYYHLMSLEPDTYREVIYLFYYVEMSIKNIAETMHMSESNTKTTLHRARKKLGKLLKEDFYEF